MIIKMLKIYRNKTLSHKALQLVDQFVYLGSNISSTESDVNIHMEKAETATTSLSIEWKYDSW